MSVPPLSCPKCKKWLPEDIATGRSDVVCPSCRARFEAEVFPAQSRSLTATGIGERIVVDGESSCFFHPEKQAVVPCDSCGRFLCALCDLDMGGKHLCPACLESGVQKGRIEQLLHKRTRYDLIAFSAGWAPLVLILCFWPISYLTGGFAIYMALRHWNAPGGPVARGVKLRMALAILFGVAQIAVGGGVLFWLFFRKL
jgi:hypothetical protein